MSLNKIAKAINTLAEAIRYHADNAPSATGRIPRYEGKEVEHPIASLATQDYAELEKRVNAEELLAGENPEAAVLAADRLNADTQPLMFAVDDGPNTPCRVNDPRFIAGFDAGWVPAFGPVTPTPPAEEADHAPDFSDDEAIDNAENYVDPYDKPALDVPGWQTLTVEELEANRADLAEYCENAAPPPKDDAAISTPSEKEAEPSEFTPSAVTVDANGLPWDARIHSSGKTLLADDTWRLKRGVPDDEREAIEAELKQLMAIPVPPAPSLDTGDSPLSEDHGILVDLDTEEAEIQAMKAGQTPPPPAPVVDAASQAAEVALAVASAPPPPPPAPSAKITLMPQLIKAITGAELGAMMVTEAVKSVGLENISQLGARPDLVPAVAEALGL